MKDGRMKEGLAGAGEELGLEVVELRGIVHRDTEERAGKNTCDTEGGQYRVVYLPFRWKIHPKKEQQIAGGHSDNGESVADKFLYR